MHQRPPMYHTFCLEQVVDHLKLNFLVDYSAHGNIKHAGEAFENDLEHEDHLLTFNWLYEGLSSGKPRGNENISQNIKNDPLEILEVLKTNNQNHNGFEAAMYTFPFLTS